MKKIPLIMIVTLSFCMSIVSVTLTNAKTNPPKLRYYICYDTQRTSMTSPRVGWHVYRRCTTRGSYLAKLTSEDPGHPKHLCDSGLYISFPTEGHLDHWRHHHCNLWRIESI